MIFNIKVFYYFLFLNIFCLNFSFAQTDPSTLISSSSSLDNSVTIREKECFRSWLDVIENPKSVKSEITEAFKNALLCTDPCLSEKDAKYYASQCYDWDAVLKLESKKKLNFHDALNLIFDTKFISCDKQQISFSKKSGTLDGIYFDPSKKQCFKPNGDSYVNFLKKNFHIAMGALYRFGNNNTLSNQNDPGGTIEASASVMYRNPSIVLDLRFTLAGDYSLPGKRNGQVVRNQADIRAAMEASIYKTFGKEYCALGIGPKFSGKVDTAGSNGIQYIPMEAAAQASLAVICSSTDLIWSMTLNGDLFRAVAFEIPNANPVPGSKSQRLFFYTYPGREFDLNTRFDFPQWGFYFGVGANWYQYNGTEVKSTILNGGGYYKYDLTKAGRVEKGLYFGLDSDFEAFDLKIPEYEKKNAMDFTGQLIGGLYF